MTVSVIAEGLERARSYFEAAPGIARQAASIALNDAARDALQHMIPDAIRRQVAFPAGYLDDPSRLGITEYAREDSLEAGITGRFRATSLARFRVGGAAVPGDRGGVQVMINPGAPVNLPGAFLVRLRAGATVSTDKFNVGLAVRLKPGESLANSRGAVRLDKGLYLLYGPSIDQVFRDVAVEVAPAITDLFEGEFFRQFGRLSGDFNGNQ